MTNTLGPYELRGELGRGAMAVVWRGFDPRLEREVAIKEPVIAAGTSEEAAAELAVRFVREGMAVAKLNHPGIVTIHAADIYEGRPAIVMELIDGETLSSILKGGSLSANSAAAILDQLLDAVGYAHSRGVIHRDIKPDNVFLTRDGRVKLADFGIAHLGTGAILTQHGTVMGTPGYMAPEQVTGEPVDARADIFAIGVLAYEMLAGQNPFGATEGAASTTVMYRIVHEEPPPLPHGVFAGVPSDLASVIAVALAKNPDERFADASTFRAALAGAPSAQTAPTRAVGATGPVVAPAQPTQSHERSRSTSWLPYVVLALIGIVAMVALAATSGSPPAMRGPAAVTTTAAGGVDAPSATEASEPTVVEAASPTPVDISDLASIKATSTNPEYTVYALIDNDLSTCWAEGELGKRDYGIGEGVTFRFPRSVVITKIRIVPGYQKMGGAGSDRWDRWYANGRVKRATFEFSGGETVTRTFADRKGYQTVTPSEPITTDSVSMRILSVRPSRWVRGHIGWDTSVSEMHVYGYEPQ